MLPTRHGGGGESCALYLSRECKNSVMQVLNIESATFKAPHTTLSMMSGFSA